MTVFAFPPRESAKKQQQFRMTSTMKRILVEEGGWGGGEGRGHSTTEGGVGMLPEGSK